MLQWWVPFIQVFWGFSFVPDSESETISSLTALPRCCHTLLTVQHPLAVLPPLGLLQLGQLAGPLRLACLSLHRVLTHQHIDISFCLCNSNSFQNSIPFCIVPGREMHHVMFCKHSLIRPLRVYTLRILMYNPQVLISARTWGERLVKHCDLASYLGMVGKNNAPGYETNNLCMQSVSNF